MNNKSQDRINYMKQGGHAYIAERLNTSKAESHQRNTLSSMLDVLDLEKYMVVMSPDELRQFETCITDGKYHHFSPDTLSEWESRLNTRNKEINARVRLAQAKSNQLCKHQTAKP